MQSQGNDEVAPIFDLSHADLQPIVESIAGEAVATFDVRVDTRVHGRYGLGGDKTIPTFSYETRSGHTGQATVLAKRQETPSLREADHYRYLAARGAPIPLLYGFVEDSQRREIIFLEYLDEITSTDWFTKDDAKFRCFLSLIAHLNAIRPCQEYVGMLKSSPGHLIWSERLSDARQSFEVIWPRAQSGTLGDAFRDLCVADNGGLELLQSQELWGAMGSEGSYGVIL